MMQPAYKPGLRGLVTNSYFWYGLLFLGVVGGILYVVFNFVVMPAYTRQNAGVEVPDVRNMTVQQAEEVLYNRNLRVERIVQRYNPRYGRDAVIDQSPAPRAYVKPNRRVFLTVNSGTAPAVTLPTLEGLSIREATGRILALGLKVGATVADTIPSQFENTVTRQAPAPGEEVAEGSQVILWYSTGLGQQLVTVPDLAGMTIVEAERVLTDLRLQYVVVGGPTDAQERAETRITRQNREPGSQVREGTEIRLFVEEQPDPSSP